LTQVAHTRSLVGVPSVAISEPGWQVFQATHAVAELLSSSQVPGAQTALGVVPPGQCVPGSHAPQEGDAVAEPEAICSVPGAHGVHGSHVD
jgi:hypothetical protein